MTEPHADQHRNLDQEPASGQSPSELPKQRTPAQPSGQPSIPKRTGGDVGSGHGSPPGKAKRPAAMRPTPDPMPSDLSIPEQSGNSRMPSEPNDPSSSGANRASVTQPAGTSTTTKPAMSQADGSQADSSQAGMSKPGTTKPGGASMSTAKRGATQPVDKHLGAIRASAQPSTTKPERASGLPVDQARDWAFAAHVGSFLLAYAGLGFLCPLIVLLAKGKASPYVRHHAVESLNFQLTALGAAVIAVLLAFVYIGLVLLPFVAIVDVVLVVMAGLAARRGEWYRYPVSIRVIN